MSKFAIAALVGLALAMSTGAMAQNRAQPAASASSTASTVSSALALGQSGTTLAAQIKENGLNICDKKADKKKCGSDSR